MKAPDLSEKFLGALIGAAAGDALGARLEGMPSVDPSDLERLEQEPGSLRYTDETHMTLGMAQSLTEREVSTVHILQTCSPATSLKSHGVATARARLRYFTFSGKAYDGTRPGERCLVAAAPSAMGQQCG